MPLQLGKFSFGAMIKVRMLILGLLPKKRLLTTDILAQLTNLKVVSLVQSTLMPLFCKLARAQNISLNCCSFQGLAILTLIG